MHWRDRSSCLQDAQAAPNPDHQLEKESSKCFSHALLKSPESDPLHMHILFAWRKDAAQISLAICVLQCHQQ